MIGSRVSNIQQSPDMATPDMGGGGASGQGCVGELQVMGRLAVQQGGDQVSAVEGPRVLAEGAQSQGVGGEAAQRWWGLVMPEIGILDRCVNMKLRYKMVECKWSR